MFPYVVYCVSSQLHLSVSSNKRWHETDLADQLHLSCDKLVSISISPLFSFDFVDRRLTLTCQFLHKYEFRFEFSYYSILFLALFYNPVKI